MRWVHLRRLLAWLRRPRFVVERHWTGPLDPFGHPPDDCCPEECGARPEDWRAPERPAIARRVVPGVVLERRGEARLRP